MVKRAMVLLAVLFLFAGCTSVDQTEHCVETRYGKVVNEKMGTGLNPTFTTDATCFDMTEQNFPGGDDDEEKEVVEAQTKDPVTVSGDVALTWSYDPATIYEVFLEKRTPEAVEVEVLNAIREGYRNALAQWTVADIFSEKRAGLANDVKKHVEAKLGNRARVHQVFIRDIKIPPAIEQARIAAAQQAQILDKAQKQFTIDSVNALALVMQAEAASKAKALEAQVYAENPALLQLEATKAMADGLAKACSGAGVQQCVIGGSVVDGWRR